MWNDFTNYGEQKPGGFFSNTTTSPTAQDRSKQPARLSNVVPVTVARILQMAETDEHLKIGNVIVSMVSLVGVLKSIDVQSTKVTYVVHDMSGPSIQAQLWLGENEDVQSKLSNIKENSYVRVIGTVRSLKGQRFLNALNVTPITDLNELTIHMLEVMHTSMSIAAADKPDASGFPTSSTSGFPTSNVGGFGASSAATFGGGNSFSVTNKGLSNPQQIVLQAIISSTNSEGVSVYDLYSNIKALNRGQIKDAIDFLSNEGHIYSTVDDDHYKSTESA